MMIQVISFVKRDNFNGLALEVYMQMVGTVLFQRIKFQSDFLDRLLGMKMN